MSLSNPSINIFQVVQRVEEVTSYLSQMAKEGGFDFSELTNIWARLPIKDDEGMTYLEAASQCILEVSNLVDKTYPELSQHQRVAKKFKLMSQLLALKAGQLEQS